ncbi:MAG: LON peptidase substrate-binding domain-containing protein [Acidobacteria bacterium]|nr:LON peptidase substrate-binding domain-containing protein [Acidobacteriota bacterium]
MELPGNIAQAGSPQHVALFPLPDHVLLPGLATPYRIFEPRYRALVADLLRLPSAERWIAVPRLAPGWERDYEGAPAFCPVASVGRLADVAPLPNGEYHIVVEPEARCRILEIASDRPYRLGRPEPYIDDPLPPAAAASLAVSLEGLVQSTLALAQVLGPAAGELASLLRDRSNGELLVFRVGSVFVPEPDERQRLIEARSPLARADQVLERVVRLLELASRRGPTKDRVPQG